MVDLPIMDAEAVDDRTGGAVVDGTYLFNPKENDAEVNYSLNEHAYTMAPGLSQPRPNFYDYL